MLKTFPVEEIFTKTLHHKTGRKCHVFTPKFKYYVYLNSA